MSENYTKDVKRLLKYSKEESVRLSTTYVGSEHLLLAIVKDIGGDAHKLLSTIGCDLDKIKNYTHNPDFVVTNISILYEVGKGLNELERALVNLVETASKAIDEGGSRTK